MGIVLPEFVSLESRKFGCEYQERISHDRVEQVERLLLQCSSELWLWIQTIIFFLPIIALRVPALLLINLHQIESEYAQDDDLELIE